MRGIALVLAGLAAACSVDRSVLDEQHFACRRDGDCIEGYGCQLLDATGNGFCAPLVDEARACDGFRTVEGLCLAECVPGAGACEGDLECLTSDVVRGEAGYCVPEDACSSDADCGDGQACMSSVIDDFVDLVWGPKHFDAATALSCVPRCGDDGSCPAGTECLDSIAADLRYCLPRCGDDAECPLGLACYATAGTSIGICIPGIAGLECRDDSSCLVGRCTAFGADDSRIQICTSPCDASVPDPDCSAGATVDDELNVFSCSAVQGAGEYCLFLGGYLHVCNPAYQSTDCVQGLECTSVVDPRTQQPIDVCARDCTWDPGSANHDALSDCSENAFCFPGAQFGFIDTCVFDLPDGNACDVGDECISRFCDMAAECDQTEGLGCCAPAT